MDRQRPRVPPAWPGMLWVGVDFFGSQPFISNPGRVVGVAGLAEGESGDAWVFERAAPGVQPLAGLALSYFRYGGTPAVCLAQRQEFPKSLRDRPVHSITGTGGMGGRELAILSAVWARVCRRPDRRYVRKRVVHADDVPRPEVSHREGGGFPCQFS